MHYCHYILVKREDIRINYSKNAIRNIAARDTESFENKLFKQRTIDSAGIFSQIYPDNVIFAEDNVERFIDILVLCHNNAMNIIKNYAAMLEKFDITEIVDTFDAEREIDFITSMRFYYLNALHKILANEYTNDVCFYNTVTNDAMNSNELLQKIKECPFDYALVVMDYDV